MTTGRINQVTSAFNLHPRDKSEEQKGQSKDQPSSFTLLVWISCPASSRTSSPYTTSPDFQLIRRIISTLRGSLWSCAVSPVIPSLGLPTFHRHTQNLQSTQRVTIQFTQTFVFLLRTTRKTLLRTSSHQDTPQVKRIQRIFCAETLQSPPYLRTHFQHPWGNPPPSITSHLRHTLRKPLPRSASTDTP